MKRGVFVGLVVAVTICGAGSAGPASGSDVPRTPAGWRVTPAGHLLTVTSGPGLSGPWGVALSPDGRHALVTSSGQAVQDETLEMFDIDTRARTDVRVMNGHRGHSVFYGVAFSPDGRRAWASGGGQDVLHSYHVTPAGRFVPDGPDPGGSFPGRDRLRSHASRRPPVRREQPGRRPLHHRVVRGSARSPGHGDQPQHRPDHRHDRPGHAGRPVRRRLQPRRDQGLRHELDRPLGVGDRHGRPARPEDDPALAGRRSAPGRPPDGDRRQPDERRDLHRECLERHGERARLAPRPALGHDRRRPRAGRAEGVDARGPRGQPRRPDALCRRRGRERRGGRRPRHSPRPRVHPDGLVPGRRQGRPRRSPARGRQHERLRRGPEPVRPVLAAPGPGMRHGHRVLAGLLREPVQRHDDPRVGAGDRPARRPRVRPPAAAMDGCRCAATTTSPSGARARPRR